MRLTGKSAVVTGAGSGIGQAVAVSFAREGARVVSVGRNREKLERARDAAGEAAPQILPYACDIADRPAVRELFAWAARELASIDILVNNAGINVPRRTLAELSPEDFDEMLRVNLSGAFYCLHEVLPHMRARRQGLIINISSIAGVRASRIGGAGYSASKFGLSSLSLLTGLEESENGIRSCLICPGEVDTPILKDRARIPSAEERAKMLQPEDVAQAALFVATLLPRATVSELIIAPAVKPFA